MSHEYFFSNYSQSTKPSFSQFKAEKKNVKGWCPRSPIPWSVSLQTELLSYFNTVKYPYRQNIEIPFEDPLRSEIRRFFISLDAYIDSPNPVIPQRDILYGAADIKFSERLKRIKRKAFNTTWAVECFEFPDWWNDIPSYEIKDIGDIFNYNYLIFFEEEEPDDYLQGLLPVEISTKDRSLFRSTIRSILPDRDRFQEISPIEVLGQISSSISYNADSKKKSPHYKLKPKKLSFSRRRLEAKRSIIRVGPQNTRDSILTDPRDLNTISLIDMQVQEILKLMPEHIHLVDKGRVDKRLKFLHRKYRWFLQRDLKKEGITKPKELLKEALLALHEEYPDIKIFENFSFYDDFNLRINDDEVISMKRGHGLGMANALTTLIQIAIFEIIKDEIIDDIPEFKSNCLVLNDDFVAGFNDEYHLEAYWDKEDEVMDRYSLLREPTKSFRSELKFVLAERYFTPDGEYEKISYQLRELLLPLACSNIVHAKEYFISAQTYIDSRLVTRYMEDIRAYWGYEFYPEEFYYPSKYGGWVNSKIDGIDLSFVLLDSLEYNTFVCRGFNATRAKVFKGFKGDLYRSPILTILGNPKFPERYNEILNNMPEEFIAEKFGRMLMKSPDLFYKYWDRLKNEREKAFKIPYSLTYEELLINTQNTYENVQFYPAKSMISRFSEVEYIQRNIKDIYIDPNPITSMLSCFNKTAYSFKEEFSIRFTNADQFSKKTSSLYSKETQRSLKNEKLSLFFTGKFDEIMIPTDNYMPEEDYIEPIKIGYVSAQINWGMGFPNLKTRFRHPLIEEKRKIYGFIFPVKTHILLSKYNLPREYIKCLVDRGITTYDDIKSTLEFVASEIKTTINYDDIFTEEGEETDRFNINKDLDEPEKNEDGQTVIGMRDLTSHVEFYLFAYHSNKEDFVPSDPIVENILGRLECLIVDLTHEHILSLDRKRELVERIERNDFSDPIIPYLAKRANLHRLLDHSIDALDSDDGLGDIFGED